MTEIIRNIFSVQLKSVTDIERVLGSNGNGSGLFFQTDHDLKAGELVTIKASIKNLPNPVFLDGWVAWRRLRARGNQLPRGLFVSLAEGEQSRLEGFLNYMNRSPDISKVRAYPRFPVFIPARYQTADGAHPAITRNISMGGALLKCSGPLLSKGARTNITLDLPDRKDKGLELRSEIVRFEPQIENQAIAVRFEPGQPNLSRLALAVKTIQKDLIRRTVPYTRLAHQT